jgi:hypothetical protein
VVRAEQFQQSPSQQQDPYGNDQNENYYSRILFFLSHSFISYYLPIYSPYNIIFSSSSSLIFNKYLIFLAQNSDPFGSSQQPQDPFGSYDNNHSNMNKSDGRFSSAVAGQTSGPVCKEASVTSYLNTPTQYLNTEVMIVDKKMK